MKLMALAALASAGVDAMQLSCVKDDRVLVPGRAACLMEKMSSAILDREGLDIRVYDIIAGVSR